MPVVSRMPAAQRFWRPRIIPVTFDAVGAGSQTAGTSVNCGLTVSGNCVVAIGMAWANNAVSSATCGGVTMTLGGSISNDSSSSNGGLTCYYLLNPLKGSSTVQFNYGSAPSFCSFNAMSYFNVGSVSTFGAFAGSVAQTVSNAFTGQLGGMIVNGISGYGLASATQSSYTQTSRYAPAGQGTTVFTQLGDARLTSATSATFGVTYSVSGTWHYSNMFLPLLPKVISG
jgi:hypothetical protein